MRLRGLRLGRMGRCRMRRGRMRWRGLWRRGCRTAVDAGGRRRGDRCRPVCRNDRDPAWWRRVAGGRVHRWTRNCRRWRWSHGTLRTGVRLAGLRRWSRPRRDGAGIGRPLTARRVRRLRRAAAALARVGRILRTGRRLRTTLWRHGRVRRADMLLRTGRMLRYAIRMRPRLLRSARRPARRLSLPAAMRLLAMRRLNVRRLTMWRMALLRLRVRPLRRLWPALGRHGRAAGARWKRRRLLLATATLARDSGAEFTVLVELRLLRADPPPGGRRNGCPRGCRRAGTVVVTVAGHAHLPRSARACLVSRR
jgi:hypothetical protein